jgi:hypothetical protein
MMWQSTSCDIVHDVVGAKRRGRDEATSTVCGRWKCTNVVMFDHIVKSDEKVGR